MEILDSGDQKVIAVAASTRSIRWIRIRQTETKITYYTRVSLSVRTDNEAAPLSVQGGGLVIRSVLSVQVGLVLCIYEKASLSVQINMYG